MNDEQKKFIEDTTLKDSPLLHPLTPSQKQEQWEVEKDRHCASCTDPNCWGIAFVCDHKEALASKDLQHQQELEEKEREFVVEYYRKLQVLRTFLIHDEMEQVSKCLDRWIAELEPKYSHSKKDEVEV